MKTPDSLRQAGLGIPEDNPITNRDSSAKPATATELGERGSATPVPVNQTEVSCEPPPWEPISSVAVPEPVKVPREVLPHPYDAPSRWQVFLWLGCLLLVLVLAIGGWWKPALGVLVAWLAVAGIFRAVIPHAWTRARGRVFDVTVLSLLVAGFLVLGFFLPV